MKSFLLLTLWLPLVVYAQKKTPKMYDLLVGGYGSSISVYRFYPETGKLAYLSESDSIKNPSYLCVDKDSRFVYAVSEKDSDSEVMAYSLAPKTGQLTFVNKQPVKGAAACYISIDEDRKNIFVANYLSGSISVLPLKEDGSVLPPSQLIQGKGRSVNKERQEAPHAHTAFLSPDEKYLLYTDLGTDKIHSYRYKDGQQQPLIPVSVTNVKPGSGPRHLDFSPDKKHVYVVQELTGEVVVFDYDDGKLKEVQTVSMLAPGFKGVVGAADIHVSADGKYVYASNRGDVNNIVVYAIAPETGLLTFVERKPTMGKAPRNFVIDPTGNFILVANQDSNSIFVFRRDKASGQIREIASYVQVNKPTCLKFAAAQTPK
ncbi:lactonase family protein [Mucilaginibacter hurinus]|uniref:Lactonase family protein n=1 Tax=Mucilaginibacter hurinus TaxID=2201324 RepID=A0A367GN10_9SPHI|nr:lactonase family protein [Mucilaginibacter hurinus]RCH54418.1 lactonase family protein [Mucilaginibacter hurinus]